MAGGNPLLQYPGVQTYYNPGINIYPSPSPNAGSPPNSSSQAPNPLGTGQNPLAGGFSGLGLAGIDYDDVQVPFPFPTQFRHTAPGQYNFGDPYPYSSPGMTPGQHAGRDYPVPENTPITSPFHAIVLSAGWNTYSGNTVEVQFSNGMRLGFGHLSYLNVTAGQQIDPGTILGASGSTGSTSTGPHLWVYLRNPNGMQVDPDLLLQPIFNGSSYRQLTSVWNSFYAGYVGGSPVTTTSLDLTYPGAASLYQKYFGRDPDIATMQDILSHGNDEASYESWIRQMASHIPGMAVGPYDDLKKLADAESMRIYGNPSNDTIIKDLYDRGLTSASGVEYGYSQLPFQPGKHVDPIVYNQVYKSAKEYSMGVWNQEPHPLDLQSIWEKGGMPGSIPPSDASDMAGTSNA